MNTFDVYIDCLCRKSSKRIGIFNRIKAYLKRPERIMYYNSLTKPLILNCSVTWISCRSHDNQCKILKLQKRCAHFILDAQIRYSSVDLFNTLGWVPYYHLKSKDACWPIKELWVLAQITKSNS